MSTGMPDIESLQQQLDSASRDAHSLITNLSETLGTWRAQPHSWSVAECLDHLACANRVYLNAMIPSIAAARSRGSIREGPATPGIFGRWFVKTQEPPVKSYLKMKAPRTIVPRSSPGLEEAYSAFSASQHEVVDFLQTHSDLDLAGIRFQNPFVSSLRLSLATGLHVIAAHERRHLWQAWQIRRAAEAFSSQ